MTTLLVDIMTAASLAWFFIALSWWENRREIRRQATARDPLAAARERLTR